MVADAGLVVSGLCRGGFFAEEAESPFNLDDNLRALDEACALNAECLILVVGGLLADSKDLGKAHSQVENGIAKLLERAKAANMPLAVEPLHPAYAADRACINTVKHAFDICEKLGAGIGVAVDVYHCWWDEDLENQLNRATEQNPVLGFHVCDWLVPTTDLLLDRGMMGDGIIDIPKIRSKVEAAGYRGYIEVEIFSDKNWWTKDPDQVLEVMCKRYREVV